MNILMKLEDWKRSHKSHTVRINHNCGYGATAGWEVNLISHDRKLYVTSLDVPPLYFDAKLEDVLKYAFFLLETGLDFESRGDGPIRPTVVRQDQYSKWLSES